MIISIRHFHFIGNLYYQQTITSKRTMYINEQIINIADIEMLQ